MQIPVLLKLCRPISTSISGSCLQQILLGILTKIFYFHHCFYVCLFIFIRMDSRIFILVFGLYYNIIIHLVNLLQLKPLGTLIFVFFVLKMHSLE